MHTEDKRSVQTTYNLLYNCTTSCPTDIVVLKYFTWCTTISQQSNAVELIHLHAALTWRWIYSQILVNPEHFTVCNCMVYNPSSVCVCMCVRQQNFITLIQIFHILRFSDISSQIFNVTIFVMLKLQVKFDARYCWSQKKSH